MPEIDRNLAAAARELFERVGFPTTHDEEWRYTNVAPIARTEFRIVDVLAALPQNLPRGVRVSRLKDASEEAVALVGRYASIEANPFVALNTANFRDAVVVEIAAGTIASEPVTVSVRSQANGTPLASHPRILVVAGAGSQASVIEEYSGTGRYFTNAVTELVVGEGAVLDHYKIQEESLEAYHVATIQIHQQRDSTVTSHSLSFGGALVRNDINSGLHGENGECTLNGLFQSDGRRHVDHHTLLDHAKPHCRSREYYRGILDGSASGVFNGKILVRKDAQKTDAIQSNKNLLLSKDAVVNTKPQLEIFADDVRCTHGATVGQLDPEARFYLRSRGISDEQARAMLTNAFAQDVLDRIKIEALRTRMQGLIV